MAQVARDELDPLAHREGIIVSHRVALAGGDLGLVDREQNRGRGVRREDAAVDLDPAVGDHDRASPVEHPPDHRPVVGARRARAVVDRIADVGRRVGAPGVVLEQRGHRLDHAQADLVGAVRARVPDIDRRGVGEQRRLAGRPPALVSIGGVDPGRAADCDQALRPALEDLGDDPQPAVLGDDEVEGLRADAALERLLKVRVLVDVPDVRDRELELVLPAVQDRHVEAALVQALHDERPGRAGPTDHERAGIGHSAHLRRSLSLR